MSKELSQTSNIDDQGNVLFLDQELLDSKEVGFPPYKNKPNGLGVFNWLIDNVIYMNRSRWPLALKLYRMFVKYSVWMKQGGWKAKAYKTGIKLSPDMEKNTGTIVMPLNVDLAEQSEKTVIPLELIKKSLKDVSFIAGMDECLCREANDCKDYPHGLGCLFLGDTARVVVKHDLAREFTYEEACARVDEAARLGLMGQAVWIEVEQMLWGIRNDMMDKLLEICFCCPCCCIAMRLARNATSAERHRFHPSGWTAVPNKTACIGCKKCAKEQNGCPVEAISFDSHGKARIDQNACVGCGICASRCDFEAIKIKQTMPMRDDLHEYFLKDYSLDLKVWKEYGEN